MTRYEAFIEKDWKEVGLANLLVARTRENGATDYAMFLVDLFCLGVKDAFHETGMTEGELREFVAERLPDEFRERFHPACAKKMIEGALAYAESLGFAPHRDFRKARKVLSGIDAADCPQEFTYGRDGRPCYIRGANDSEERVDRVLAILEAKCGPEGFDFEDPEAAEKDAAEFARENLQDWLEEQDDTVPEFYEFSGIVTGMLLCPAMIQPLKIMEELWPPPGRIWKDEAEAQQFADLLMNYWNEVNSLILYSISPAAKPGETCIDSWEEDFGEDDGPGYLEALRNWAAGVMRATKVWPKECAQLLTRSDLAPHWELIRLFAKLEEPGNSARIDAMRKESPPRMLGPSLMTIARALRQPLPE